MAKPKDKAAKKEKKEKKAAKKAAKTSKAWPKPVTENSNSRSQIVKVPIDDPSSIGIQASPTFGRDDIQSVTLTSFRKVVGYDTFNSILKQDRDESKDPADYYNVTVSMMIKRNPVKNAQTKKWKDDQGKTLRQVIDKGFPYDDNFDPEEHAQVVDPKKQTLG